MSLRICSSNSILWRDLTMEPTIWPNSNAAHLSDNKESANYTRLWALCVGFTILIQNFRRKLHWAGLKPSVSMQNLHCALYTHMVCYDIWSKKKPNRICKTLLNLKAFYLKFSNLNLLSTPGLSNTSHTLHFWNNCVFWQCNYLKKLSTNTKIDKGCQCVSVKR